MKQIIKNLSISVFAAAALLMGACSDWTQTENLDQHKPTLENQNPELYKQYLEALRTYKQSDHKIVYASMTAGATAPAKRNDHLTIMPDSVDFICLSFSEKIHAAYVKEIAEVRTKKGTRTVYPISFDAMEKRWKEILEEEAAAKPEVTADGEDSGDSGEEEPAGPTDEERFLAFCKEQTEAQVAYCDLYGFDGIEITCSGRAPASMPETVKAEYAARQQAFFSVIAAWKAKNTSALLFFQGNPQNLIDMTILASCDYIIIPALTAASGSVLSYNVLMAAVTGVPVDRFLIGVSCPSVTDPTDETGYFAGYDTDGKNRLRATKGAAEWVVEGGLNVTKSGIAITNAQNDYYNITSVYKNVREAITIMNPTSKN